MYRKKCRRGLTALLHVLACVSTLLIPAQVAISHRASEDVSAVEISRGPDLAPLPQEADRASLQAGSITIQNNNFEGNKDYGLNSNITVNAEDNWWGDANGPTHASNPQGHGDAVSDNVDFDPWLTSAVNIGLPYLPSPKPGIITLSNNSFEDNANFGVQSSIPINAAYNWWGHPSGPYHSETNPDGQGDAVSDNVDYDPWLVAPPGSRPSSVPLVLGQPMTGTASQLGYVDYHLVITGGLSLLVEVVPLDGSETLWVYSRLGTLPLWTRYDLRVQEKTRRGVYELLISPTQDGIYYFSIYGRNVSETGGNYQIVVKAVERYLSDISPRSAGNAGEITLNVSGLAFVEDMNVELRKAGLPTLAADNVALASPTTLWAHFDLNGIATGVYNVYAVWPGGGEEGLIDAFTITQGTGPYLEADLVAPEAVRPGRQYALRVEYANTGDSDMTAPLLRISAEGADLRLPEQDNFVGSSIQLFATDTNGPAGILSPNAGGRISLIFKPTISGGTIGFSVSRMVPSESASGNNAPLATNQNVPRFDDQTFSEPRDNGSTPYRIDSVLDVCPRVEVRYGQSDREIVDLIPELDLQLVIQPHPGAQLPALDFVSDLQGISKGLQNIDSAAAITDVLESQPFPDTLLLFSDDWYGDRLRQAAENMGLELTQDQLNALESVAIARSVNTRLLLTIARVKNAPNQFTTYQEWLRWLYLETSRIRAALGPFAREDIQSIQFRDGRIAYMQPETTNTAFWALVTVFGAGKTLDETEQALSVFRDTYMSHFGDPTIDEAQGVATAPFLYKPYNIDDLEDRGYYDHTYPSVDNRPSEPDCPPISPGFYPGQPNICGMLDYLGRTNTKYDSHDGDDFWLPDGSDVYAPVTGIAYRIPRGCTLTCTGYLIIPHSPENYEIVIDHLSTLTAANGSEVTQGQLIGESGRAGGVDHIHFEVRHNGKQTDSMGWYGGGNDPCPSGSGATGNYKGCEASVWLWADENPPVPPDPPSELSASATGQTSIHLEWADTNYEDGFKIFRDDSPIATTETNVTSYDDNVPSCSTTYRYYVKAYNNAGDSEPSNTDTATTDNCPPDYFEEVPIDHEDTRIIRPIDPNEKVGPEGLGPERVVSVGDELGYIIYFENVPTATAPAQEVVIVDNLDPDLDWATFQITEIAFGDRIIAVREKADQFYTQETIPDYRDGVEKSWWVDITAQLDYHTGQVSWILRTLDPETGQLPEDPVAGFLPPNDETGRGEGHVAFNIKPRSDLADGTMITNQASIVFDTEAPIVTNEVWNTIGEPLFPVYLPLILRNS